MMNTLKQLFASYDNADQEVERAQKLLNQALKSRSDCVRNIVEDSGSKGPFAYKGDLLKAVKRGETFFFKGKKKEANAITIVDDESNQEQVEE